MCENFLKKAKDSSQSVAIIVSTYITLYENGKSMHPPIKN